METSVVLRMAAAGAFGGGGPSSDLSIPKMWQDHSWCKNHMLITPQSGRKKMRISCQNKFLRPRSSSWKVSSSANAEPLVLEKGSMDELYDALAARIFDNMTKPVNPDAKYVVGLAGPPGAGKSTVASEVVNRLNRMSAQRFPNVETVDFAVVIPMDGFHLYRSQLDAMEDPQEAHARRGAPWTFDPVLLLKCLQTLRKQGSVFAPSFDHGIGDPVEGDIFVGHHHKAVIVEGNYLLLEDGPWKELSSMFDEKWFLDVDLDAAMERVLKRHMTTGKTPEAATWRVEYNDRPNAELIMKSKGNADVVIKSVDWEG